MLFFHAYIPQVQPAPIDLDDDKKEDEEHVYVNPDEYRVQVMINDERRLCKARPT